MTVNSRVIRSFVEWIPDAVDVPLMNDIRVQILPTMTDIRRARKYQYAAFIADSRMLVVWDDDPLNVVTRAKQIEKEIMNLVWQPNQDDLEEVEAKMPAHTKVEEIVDLETGEVGYREQRPTMLMNTILVALTLVLIIIMLGAGYRQIAIETAVDGNYLRVAFVALTPVQIF